MKHPVPLLFLAFASLVLTRCVLAQSAVLQLNERSKVVIALPQTASLPEQTAARELDDYLTRITGGDFRVQPETSTGSTPGAIYVGNTQFARRAGVDGSTLASEEWRIKTQNGNLILVGGGTRGTLYATYRFLEDNAGVRWWNPWEETVPKLGVLPVLQIDRRGKPVFGYRDIHMVYGNDSGRFAIRNRLNTDGVATISPEYGGSREYGKGFLVHTFYRILSPAKYFAAHPDWFLVPDGGTPSSHNSQLHMSNPEMRQEFLKLFREILRKSQQDAKEKGVSPPDTFSVSQEDNKIGFAGPNDAALLAKNNGAEAAILLDFINFLADGIKDEFPGVYVDTLAYFSGEKAPTNIRPRENVVIRLTDTTSNLILPVTHPRNHEFHDNVVAWGKLTQNLRIWDYAVTYAAPGLPMPTAHTYPTDYRFLKANNVEGLFTEHEFPILADMRDFKIWVQCKMLEDPNRDYNALMREFTDGFYGKAGVHVRRYIIALQSEVEKVGKAKGYEEMSWFVPARQYNYLSLDFLIRANEMFNQAERAAGTDKVLARRVRHARMPLDRFITLFHRNFANRWVRASHTPESLPLNRDVTAARYLQSWNEQIDLRLPESERAAEREKASTEFAKMTIGSLYRDKIPTKFRNIPASKLIVYGPRDTRLYGDQAKVVADPQAELGEAARLLVAETPETERARYKMPMPWGVYDVIGKKDLVTNAIKAEEVPGTGYHWHRLDDVKLTENTYLYFFWSWVIQLDLSYAFDENTPEQQFEVWANLKFEGPSFPHGKAEDKNAISVERVVLVKK